LHARGFRYRLHDPSLPGKPDLSFPKYRAVILVNGCFWHGHDCHLFKWPSTRREFWHRKITRNRQKDEETRQALEKLGWRVGVIHECALKGKTRLDPDRIIDTAEKWLRSRRESLGIEGIRGKTKRTNRSEKRVSL
ncbi:MAG: very short patch repair endonuclease, partial [Gammaproteobacteria bacterium]|nr:very short patch repair endonuclease [Gammaproteobacteria bacterium]